MRKVVLRNAALAALSVSSILYTPSAQAESSKAYRYEVPVTLRNNDFQLDSYQVAVTLDTATLISSGKLQADGSDLRVIDANGRLQPHYIESGLNTSSTLIWIRVYHIPGLNTADLRILTGNAGAENTSNPSETFAWTQSGAYLATQGGAEGKGKFPSYYNYRVEAKVSEFVGYNPSFRWVTDDNRGYGLFQSNGSSHLGTTTDSPSGKNKTT